MKLLIRNLARNTTESRITELLTAFGQVQSCTLVMDEKTGKSKGFGFAEMPNNGEAKAAMQKLNNTIVDDNKIRVKKAVNKT